MHCWPLFNVVPTRILRSFSVNLLSCSMAPSEYCYLGLFLFPRCRTLHFLLNIPRFLSAHLQPAEVPLGDSITCGVSAPSSPQISAFQWCCRDLRGSHLLSVCHISFLLALTDSAPCGTVVPGRVIKPSALPLSIKLTVLDNQVWEPFSVRPRRQNTD